MQNVTIGVVGAGLMGHGIAQDFASAGHSVLLHDIDELRLSRARELISENLQTLAGLQLAGAVGAEEILSRVSTETSLRTLAERCDYIVEAVVEDLAVKQEVFSVLDRHAPAHAIFASNTSSLLVDQLACRTKRADRMLVTHYFNPPYLVPLVEVVRGSATSEETTNLVIALLQASGKKTAVLRRAVPGFLVNRLQAALVREAVSLIEQGVASHEDIDTALRNSIAPRMSAGGLFEVHDLTGWDIVLAVCANVLPDLCRETRLGNPARKMVADGHLGVKSMQGFYKWSTESVRDLRSRITQAFAGLHRA
jgi:3-hydroxybutyryl-CoA dehydrogenase